MPPRVAAFLIAVVMFLSGLVSSAGPGHAPAIGDPGSIELVQAPAADEDDLADDLLTQPPAEAAPDGDGHAAPRSLRLVTATLPWGGRAGAPLPPSPDLEGPRRPPRTAPVRA